MYNYRYAVLYILFPALRNLSLFNLELNTKFSLMLPLKCCHAQLKFLNFNNFARSLLDLFQPHGSSMGIGIMRMDVHGTQRIYVF